MQQDRSLSQAVSAVHQAHVRTGFPMVPVSIEAEEAVISSLLIDPDAITKVAGTLGPGDFYRESNAWIYEAIVRLERRNVPADVVTVSDELERAGQLEAVGGFLAVSELSLRMPTAVHVVHYAGQVERAAFLRRLLGAAEQIARLVYQAPEDEDIAARAESILGDALRRRTREAPRHIREVLGDILDEIEALRTAGTPPGMPSSLDDLGDLLGGYHRGEQTVLVARPAVGKSSLAAQEAWHLARKGYTVLVVSLEMSRWSVSRRLMARAGGINLKHLRNGLGQRASAEEWNEFQERANLTAGQLGELPIYLDDKTGVSALEIRAKAKSLMAHLGKLDFMIVDYLGLVSRDRSGKIREDILLGDAAQVLRETARELGCHNLLLHQLNREAARGKPALHHIAESGWIERHADIVLAIHDPVMAGEEQALPSGTMTTKQIYVLKQRNGETAFVETLFDGPRQAWHDKAPEWIEDQAPPPPVVSRNGNGNGQYAQEVSW